MVASAVTPEQIKQLRNDLRCTARELATTLGLPLAEVQAWESGQQFPTKRWVTQLEALLAKGPLGIVRKAPRSKQGSPSAMGQLDNPEVWRLLRKLLAHPQLLKQALELAAPYEDPAASTPTE